MSHYNVNASVPKTLIQHLIRFVAASGDVDEDRRRAVHGTGDRDISGTGAGRGGRRDPVDAKSGRPLCASGFQSVLCDAVRFPSVAHRLSRVRAWCDVARGSWPEDIPVRTAGLFARRDHPLASCLPYRFFANQFKRSALPNGPKISSGGSLSPRGDWRAPSDGNARVWLEELKANVPDS